MSYSNHTSKYFLDQRTVEKTKPYTLRSTQREYEHTKNAQAQGFGIIIGHLSLMECKLTNFVNITEFAKNILSGLGILYCIVCAVSNTDRQFETCNP